MLSEITKTFFNELKCGDIKNLQQLIDSGVDVNTKDSETVYGITPLTVAVYNGNKEIIKLLLKNGADINQLGRGNSTILLEALTISRDSCYVRDNMGVIKLLFQYGANKGINLQATNGVTPLMFACTYPEDLEIVELLLENGASAGINLRDVFGHTALMIACERYNFNNDSRDENKFTKHYSNVIKLLLTHGAIYTLVQIKGCCRRVFQLKNEILTERQEMLMRFRGPRDSSKQMGGLGREAFG